MTAAGSPDKRVALLLGQARQLLDAGRVADAAARLGDAELLDRHNAAVPHDRGVLALRLGQWSAAASAFARALAIEPRFAAAALRLGVAQQAAGAFDAALSAFALAARLAPDRAADAHHRRGALLEALGRFDEAERAYDDAAAIRPATAASRLGGVRALLARDRPDEAEHAARALLAAHPGHVEATDALGSILADRGAFAEAADCFERAARAAPAFSGSFYDLVQCRPAGAIGDDLLAAIERAAASPVLHADARARAELALGKVADDRGDPGRAMRHFARADVLRRGARPDTAAPIERRVERVIAAFDRARIAPAAVVPPRARGPILVMGLPRSGTTLVEQILSSHPAVGGAGELPFWTEAGARAERAGFIDDDPARTASDYRALLRARVPGRARVTDKAPLNLFWAGLIAETLPDATLVICRRRPIDVALSIGRTAFNPLVDFPTGGAALPAAVRALERLAEHWRAILPTSRLVEIRYETLVASPEPTIRALLAGCDLAWDEACLAPERNPRSVRTPSRWQVRAPITAPAPDRWRRYEPWLGPLAVLRPSKE